MRIDLHLHSTASDGALTPDALVRTARNAGLDIIALTDHDTIDGVEIAQAEAERSGPKPRPTIIPGIEISSTLDGEELHILGYFVDPAHPTLRTFGDAAAKRRRERMQAMIDKLEELGVHVLLEDVLRVAGPESASIGRPHLARALVEQGSVASFGEAFERYLADDGPAHVPIQLLSSREAIDLIHNTGGIAVWAHPPHPTFEDKLDAFVDWGLDGVECYRPRNSEAEVSRLLDAAHEHDLLVTGGSDWHGEWHGPLGSFHVDRDQVEALLQAGGL